MDQLRTMFEVTINEYDEEITAEYLVSELAIKHYLESDKDEDVDRFLKEEYTSEDTNNIINLCIAEDFEFKIVGEELTGEYL